MNRVWDAHDVVASSRSFVSCSVASMPMALFCRCFSGFNGLQPKGEKVPTRRVPRLVAPKRFD